MGRSWLWTVVVVEVEEEEMLVSLNTVRSGSVLIIFIAVNILIVM